MISFAEHEEHVAAIVDVIASRDSVPAGGAAAVVAAAMGVALAIMATRISKSAARPRLADIELDLLVLNRELVPLFSADRQAFSGVLTAQRSPESIRRYEHREAFVIATTVPIRIAELGLRAVGLIDEVAPEARPSLHCDVAAGRLLLLTGARISVGNARANLEHLSPPDSDPLRARLSEPEHQLSASDVVDLWEEGERYLRPLTTARRKVQRFRYRRPLRSALWLGARDPQDPRSRRGTKWLAR